MNIKCYIDKTIKLTKDNILLLEKLNIDLINFDESLSNLNNIEIMLFHSNLPDDQLKKMTNCKYIGVRAHNTDYINLDLAKKQNIIVKGLNKQHAVNAVAEHTFSLILAISKNIINSYNNVLKNEWKNNLRLNYEISNKTLGIVGYGQIGKKVAEIGKAFGMKILISGKEDELKPGEIHLEDMLKYSDIISIHLSSNDSNFNYINKEHLKLMKKDSILINTARGSLLDYIGLIDELHNDKFLGVGLDVFDNEPLLDSRLKSFSNVILTPHIGFKTQETLENMNTELIENLKEYINSL